MPKTRQRPSQLRSRRAVSVTVSKSKCKTLILGIGGAGNDAVNKLAESGLVGVECIAINTDLKDLSSVSTTRKVLIGEKVTRGLSAGGNTAVGKSAVEESKPYIEAIMENADVVFVVAGLGGGTGTGAAPVVAEIARQKGAVTVAAVTMPLITERGRMELATRALSEMQRTCDTIVLIDNNRILQLAPALSTTEALRMANHILVNLIKGIVEGVSSRDRSNIDLADFKTVVRQGGIATVWMGESHEPNRAEQAVRNALKTPLLDVDFAEAKGALIDVSGDSGMTLEEVNKVEKMVTGMLAPNASVRCAARLSNNIESGLKVTIVMTGMDSAQVLSRFGNMIPELYDIESSFEERETTPPIDLALDQIEDFRD